jgi:hypothetical protein
MTALAADRKFTITAGAGRERVGLLAANAKIFHGSVIAKNAAGFLVPASDTVGLRVVGVAQEQVDNTGGADGALSVKYITALSVKMANDGTSPVAQANLYAGVVYIKDDNTVQASGANGVVAGCAESIEPDGTIIVYIAPELTAGTEDVAAGVETITTATALSAFTRLSLLQPNGTMAMTLPAGRYKGQLKTIRMIGGSSTPIANVAGAYNTDGTATANAQFNAAADQLDAEWNGTAWQVLNNVSVTLS